MASGGRSISDVVQDIVANVENIIRSEVRLAKTELTSQLRKIRVAIPMLIVGATGLLLAAFFLSWTAIFALAVVIPMWAAALVITVLLAFVGGIALIAGIRMLVRMQPPERTISSMKENVLWMKQQAK